MVRLFNANLGVSMKKKNEYDVIFDALMESAIALYAVSEGCLPVSLIEALGFFGVKQKDLFKQLDVIVNGPKKKTKKARR